MPSQLYPCFGLEFLGTCAYNPAQPTLTYFTVGDAIAALGFMLAIQQLFKPIYLFRLRAYGLRILYLAWTVFFGALCSIIALLLPNLPLSHTGIFEYPITWELLGAFLMGAAYSVVALVSLYPAKLYSFNLMPFIRAAAKLLSEAVDEDRASIADDLLRDGRNVERLITFASTFQKAELHESRIEFEKLSAAGQPLVIHGRPPISPFFRFTHRLELEQAAAAGTFLRILADPEFCLVLVRKCPWITASLLKFLAENRLHDDQAEPFIREIARQGLVSDESMISKETGYTGFGSVSVLSKSLFENWFILQHYDPLGRLSLHMPKVISEEFVVRLNCASEMMLETSIEVGGYWSNTSIRSVQSVYEAVCRQWSYARAAKSPVDYSIHLNMGIESLCRSLRGALANLEWNRKQPLYITDVKEFRHDLVKSIAGIAYESLACLANNFSGFDDDAWMHAIGLIHEIYPAHESEPVGMDPLQQQLALLLLDKLRDNMNGYYPAMTRVLLATIGPYTGTPNITKRTAYIILKDAIYQELKKLPALHAKNPEKFDKFLPETTTYDSASQTLIHTYRGGNTVSTNLPALVIVDQELTDKKNWQEPNDT